MVTSMRVQLPCLINDLYPPGKMKSIYTLTRDVSVTVGLNSRRKYDTDDQGAHCTSIFLSGVSPISTSQDKEYPADNNLTTLRDFRKSMEKQYLQDLISQTKRDIKKACQVSGLSRSRLYELLTKHKISNH